MSETQNWKNAEARLKEIFELYNIPAHLESKEGRESSKSTYDVRILAPDVIQWCCDSKYSGATFRHHTLLETIEKKYVKKKNDRPVLYSKNKSKRYGVFSVKDKVFLGLLAYWLGTMTKEEILAKWSLAPNEQ